MTATAGPGISLMAEFAGLGYYVEIPGVIWDIQRVGPSTGLPTRTSQGDISFVAKLSHGDTRHPMLLPCSVAECFSMASDAFDLAEQLQTPVFVMSDLDLGMNNWMSEPFQYPEKPQNRGKVLTAEDLRAAGRLRALQRRGRRRHRLPHAAGDRSSQRGVVRARQRSQREVAVQRAARRLRQQHGPPGAQVRDRAHPGSQAGDRAQRRQRSRHHRLRHLASRGGRDPRPVAKRIRREGRLPAAARLSLHAARRTTSSPRTSGFTWSTRTATRRCCSC